MKKVRFILTAISLSSVVAIAVVSNFGFASSSDDFETEKQSSGTAELKREKLNYSWSFDSNTQEHLEVSSTNSNQIHISNVPWIQIVFGHTYLGENSYIELISAEDGGTQLLTSKTLSEWNQRSAYFNGDTVEINVVVDPSDKDVAVNITDVIVGKATSLVTSTGKNGPVTESICGGSDDRVASNERRVGRIDPIGCTAWTIGNGKLLTAGHCLSEGAGRARTLSFNVPASGPGGGTRFPGPESQYAINGNSFVFRNNGVGDDWGVFTVSSNSETNQQPNQAQGSFSRQRNFSNTRRVRVTGFGGDDGTANQTNQTHVGNNAGSSGNIIRHTADTSGGNSGGPIIDVATGAVIGIHTNGGCGANAGTSNAGTSFNNNALRRAIRR